MKNQLLETLLKIQKKIQKTKGNSIPQLLEDNRVEIEFLKSKFNINDQEALLMAACCIHSIADTSFVFGIDEISYLLSINNLEFLLYQNDFQNLVGKNYLSESVRQPTKFSNNDNPVFPIFNKEFALHQSLADYFH